MRLFFKLASISIRSQMAHRASFFMLAISHFLSTFVGIFGIWVLFDRFKLVEGWTLAEVALIYGVVHMGFSIAESVARGFDTFDRMVKMGEFDRVLLRPLGTLFQIAVKDVQLMRIGRFLQGLVVLAIGIKELALPLGPFHYIVLCLAIVGVAALFYGLFVLQATLAFWTTESLELMNITTYGGVEAAQFPMTIYPEGFRLFFTLVIPLACVAYYPLATLLQHESFPIAFALLFPLGGVLFLLISCLIWHLGVRHYTSTGS